MQEALPYKTWSNSNHKAGGQTSTGTIFKAAKTHDVRNLVSQNAVLVLGKRGCCMIHVVERLLQGQGVNPAVHEFDEQDENDVIRELQTIDAGVGKDRRLQFPVVFIGGRVFGGLDRVMAAHISGELIPALKEAHALWL